MKEAELVLLCGKAEKELMYKTIIFLRHVLVSGWLYDRADKAVYRASKWQHFYVWVKNRIQLMLPRITSCSLAPCCSIPV